MVLSKTRWLLAALLVLLLLRQTALPQLTRWQSIIEAARKALFEDRLADAEQLFMQALKETKQFGPEEGRLAESLDGLASVYTRQGRYAEAEPIRKRALEVYEKVYGPDHRDAIAARRRLARLYRVEGKYAEAEPLFLQDVADAESRFGPEHPAVLASLEELARLYVDQGKDVQAEPLYQRALTIWEKAQGPEYPYVARMVLNLAEICRRQARYAEAEPLYQRALAIYDEHRVSDPLLPGILEKYARFLRNIGREAQADELEARARSLRAKTAQDPYN